MPFKILIIDDQPDNLKKLVKLISSIDPSIELLRTTRPVDALEICRLEKPQIVITDWEMPELNGLELIVKLKADAETASIQIIMCTGIMTSSKNLRAALEAGAIDYIRKPVDPVELEARLNSVIRLCDSQKQVANQMTLLEHQKDEIAEQKKKREEFLIEKLTLKEKDISELAIMLAQKQDMAKSLVEKIKQIRRQRTIVDPELNELFLSLNIQLQDHEVERTISDHIHVVNAAFYNKLTEAYPDLTRGEKELCGLIRAGVNSKQIAELKRISPDSVGKNRHRLRKKLGIGSEMDLDQLLKTI